MTTRAQIKDTLIQRDATWLRSVGVEPSARQIDEHVTAGLDKAAAKARERRKAPQVVAPAPAPPPVENGATVIAREAGYDLTIGARKRRAVPGPVAYSCGKCGTCVRCRRELRAMNILRMARQGDDRLKPLASIIIGASVRAQAGLGEFDGLGGHDKARILTRIIEDVCDRSVPVGGAWR